MEPKEPLGSSIVKLNVGGKKYVEFSDNITSYRYLTSRSTLIANGANFFTALLENDDSGRVPAVRDEVGGNLASTDSSGWIHVYRQVWSSI